MKKVTFNGKKYSLFTNSVRKNGTLTFSATDTELNNFELKSKDLTLISSFPAITTGVCDTQTKWLNTIAQKYEDRLEVVAISMDLPFTLQQWCINNGIRNIKVVSDYKRRVFGSVTGLLIDDLFLLARSAILVNRRNRILYVHVNAQTNEQLPFAEIEEAIEEVIR